MTDAAALAAATVAVPLAGAGVAALPWRGRAQRLVVCAVALLTAAIAAAAAARGMLGAPQRDGWVVLDPLAGVLLAVVAAVGLLASLLPPATLGGTAGLLTRRRYAAVLLLFWAALLAVPLAGNLAVAWLLVEATTAASALLVAGSGGRRALEAGWKYLVLTTLGLTIALLGIVVLSAALSGGGDALAALDWGAIHAGAGALPDGVAVAAGVLLVAGFATKAGWAPVHNWLPDAHGEGPPAVSALLSGALLPAVLLVVWRIRDALAPSAAGGAVTTLLIAFGLASLALAVPFLWRPLPLKRLLAYSSMEHMGVLALGVGFGSPLALAGVVLHVAGHALAKSLGFAAAIPLLAVDPTLARRAPAALPAASRAGAGAVGVSLVALGGLPPSPLFFSELLILAGGIAAGKVAVVAVAGLLLALGFLGLAHAAIEALCATRPAAARRSPRRRERRLLALTVIVVAALLALSAGAWALPDSELVARLVRGVA